MNVLRSSLNIFFTFAGLFFAYFMYGYVTSLSVCVVLQLSAGFG